MQPIERVAALGLLGAALIAAAGIAGIIILSPRDAENLAWLEAFETDVRL